MTKKETKVGIFSFFAGAGFLDLGFESVSNFEILFVNEYHEPFINIYKSSRNTMSTNEPEFGYHNSDISTFLENNGSKYLKKCVSSAKSNFNLVGFIGGPPCPDFSIAGKNKGASGENGKLSGIYIDLIIKNSPDFFLFENVKGLYRTVKHRAFFNSMKKKLSSKGYYLTEKLINAIEYGTPQDRERIILIGFKKETLKKMKVNLSPEPVLNTFDWHSKIALTTSEIFSMNWPSKRKFSINSSMKCPKGLHQELTVEHWFKKNDVENHPNSKHCFQPRAGLAKFKIIDEGDDLKKSYKRLHRWRYSPTAAYGNNEVHLHPYKARRISVAEALAIQSLPKSFVIPDNISLTNMFKTIGNGVPFLAAKGLAETIISYIEDQNN